jgi:hypothetical protein
MYRCSGSSSDGIVDGDNSAFVAAVVLRPLSTLVLGRLVATRRLDVEWNAPVLFPLALSTDPVDDEGVEHVDSSAFGDVERERAAGGGAFWALILPMERGGRECTHPYA